MCCLASKRWDTRTRTKNDRTRICSVTITPYPTLSIASSGKLPICVCKVSTFLKTIKTFKHFFSKKMAKQKNRLCFMDDIS